jgi:hypothetical protein
MPKIAVQCPTCAAELEVELVAKPQPSASPQPDPAPTPAPPDPAPTDPAAASLALEAKRRDEERRVAREALDRKANAWRGALREGEIKAQASRFNSLASKLWNKVTS